MNRDGHETVHLDLASPNTDAALRLIQGVQEEFAATISCGALLGAALLYVRNAFSMHTLRLPPNVYIAAIASLAASEIRGQVETMLRDCNIPDDCRAMGIAAVADSFAEHLAANLARPVSGPVSESLPGPSRKAS